MLAYLVVFLMLAVPFYWAIWITEQVLELKRKDGER